MTEPAGGYSGTPLARKLGVKQGHLVLLRHAPAGWAIPDLPPEVTVSRRAAAAADGHGSGPAPHPGPSPSPGLAAGAGPAPDIIVAFCRSRRLLERELADLTSRLPATGSLWIAWPRRAGGHSSDITENGLRELLLPVGVVDVKVAALDHDWSGLKFVWRKAVRK